MFFNKPLSFSKESWHYKVWRFFYWNWVWKVRPPEKKSICPYFWKTVFTLLVFLWLIYPMLVIGKCVVLGLSFPLKPFKEVLESELLGFPTWTFIIGLAIIVLAVLPWTIEPVFFILSFIAILVVIVVIAAIAIAGIKAVIDFDSQVIYNLKYGYENKWWELVLFWLQTLILATIIIVPPILSSAVLKWYAIVTVSIVFLGGIIIAFVLWGKSLKKKKALQAPVSFEKIESGKKPGKVNIIWKGFWSGVGEKAGDTWEFLSEFFKATKKKVCPTITFVDNE